MTILVTGSRDWTDINTLKKTLWDIYQDAVAKAGAAELPVTLIEGGARGADRMARDYANDRGWTVDTHDADWEKWGMVAGHVRNQEMVDLKPDVVVGFWKNSSTGTADCLYRAHAAKLTVKTVREN